MATSRWPWILPIMLLAIAGCTIVDGSSIPVGQQRPPISPSQVKIYAKFPANYEEVAIVSAKAGHDFKAEQSLTDAAVQRLREEAARMGANGVVIQSLQSRSNGIAEPGPHDGYNKVNGVAIYVPPGN